eukprot:Em0021g593a
MNQRTYLGTSYLDVAKVAIEMFMKYRSRDPASRGDRYMLVTFEEPPNAIKAGWKENHATFISELKNLKAVSLTSFSRALKEAFDLLNVHRLHTGIDYYGQGRNPFFLEPAVVIAITDGGKAVNSSSTDNELLLPAGQGGEGCELTKELYRWDQRLFTVVLRLPGVGGASATYNESNHLSQSSIYALCEATGGKGYTVVDQKSLTQCMESLTQKLYPGVVIHFQKLNRSTKRQDSSTPMEVGQLDESVGGKNGGNQEAKDNNGALNDSNGGSEGVNSWHSTRKMIYVKINPKTNRPAGYWPIPESYWPELNLSVLPARDVHPVVLFDASDTEPMLVENFPFDKYELEPSPLTQYILEKRNPNVCWQVYIGGSGKDGVSNCPFGYLKAASNLSHVTMFVMPYNYPKLLPLIEDLHKFKMRPPPKWKQDFSEYIASVPPYYCEPLKKALRLMGAPPVIIPDTMEGQMSYSVATYLKKLSKQARLESERVVSSVAKSRTGETIKRTNGIIDLGDGISLAIGSTHTKESTSAQSFRNPFDIARSCILEQLNRMRINFLHSTATTPNLIEEAPLHEQPISQMGNYQDYLKRINPLRELDSGSVRTQLFGNPFKLERPSDNKKDADIELADEHMVEYRRSSSVNKRRRRSSLRSPKSPSPSPSPPPSSTLPSSPTLQSAISNLPPPPPPPTAPPQSPAPEITIKPDVERSPSPEDLDCVMMGGINGPVTLDDGTEGKSPAANDGIASESEGNNNNGPTVVDLTSPDEPFAFTISQLPSSNETKNCKLLQLDKNAPVSRKRERSPSPPQNPTVTLPPIKKVAVNTSTESVQKFSVNIVKLVSGDSKTPSPVPGLVSGRLSKPELSSASKVLNEEIQKQQAQENDRLKDLIIKEVRKLGKNHQALFQHLENVKGSVEERKKLVEHVVKEATKFKKKQLVEQLEEWSNNLSSLRTVNSDFKGRPATQSQRR